MNIRFILREAFRGLGRNLTMTIALIITVGISLALISTGLLTNRMMNDTKDLYLDKVEYVVQFDDITSADDQDCTKKACTTVFNQLNGAPGVAEAVFISRKDAWARFVELFGTTERALVEQSSEDSLPASIHVRLTDPTDQTALDAVRNLPQVKKIVEPSEDIANALNNLDAIRFAVFAIAAFQAVASLLLIINMVQIAAFNRGEAAEIMRIVGASRWLSQTPFVIEAGISAFIGTVLAAVGLILGMETIVDPALQPLVEAQILAPISTNQELAIVGLVGLVGIVVASLTAHITLRAYVRK